MKRLLSLITALLMLGSTSANAGEDPRVIIDPGHGGKDRGAIWGGVHEATLNLQVARQVEKLLKSQGIRVTLTRRTDIFMSLDKRAEIANRYDKAHFVSIHFNAFTNQSIRGMESFYAGRRGYSLARDIHREFNRRIRIRNRGLHYRPYAVLTRTRHPAALIECGFISNRSERARCTSKGYQQQVAKAITAGILRSIQ